MGWGQEAVVNTTHNTVRRGLPLHDNWISAANGNTARLARRSDEALGVRVSVTRIAPWLLDLERAGGRSMTMQGTDYLLTCAVSCNRRRSGYLQRNVYKACLLCLSARAAPDLGYRLDSGCGEPSRSRPEAIKASLASEPGVVGWMSDCGIERRTTSEKRSAWRENSSKQCFTITGTVLGSMNFAPVSCEPYVRGVVLVSRCGGSVSSRLSEHVVPLVLLDEKPNYIPVPGKRRVGNRLENIADDIMEVVMGPFLGMIAGWSLQIGLDSRWGRSRIFACENRAGQCRWSAGFLGDLPFPHPCISALLHPHLVSPISAFKTSLLRAPYTGWQLRNLNRKSRRKEISLQCTIKMHRCRCSDVARTDFNRLLPIELIENSGSLTL
ncbi:hypothetical protein PR048_006090 [Dryococelus australis]|uniref:Uncharacterized protein n=1 Tax=Dryococelus australis TaxID=614101 RepID=A0ABQ9IA05_9NEOP|nr:hypothetical protein PR048_006090 [Dryococelus australis]